MTVDGLLARGRAAHADLMVDACTITRTTLGTLNESTGLYGTSTATVYTGPCRIKPAATRTADVATIAADVSRPVLEVPYDATGASAIRADDRVTITAGGLAGQTFAVYSVDRSSTQTVRRFTVEAVL